MRALHLPDFPWDSLAADKALAAGHPGGIVDLSVGTPVDPVPAVVRDALAGRDVLEAFKIAAHAEAFHDATRTVIKDQEDAGLDIVTDGQMWFDDYHMGIGSFLWYWLERTSAAHRAHEAAVLVGAVRNHVASSRRGVDRARAAPVRIVRDPTSGIFGRGRRTRRAR